VKDAVSLPSGKQSMCVFACLGEREGGKAESTEVLEPHWILAYCWSCLLPVLNFAVKITAHVWLMDSQSSFLYPT